MSQQKPTSALGAFLHSNAMHVFIVTLVLCNGVILGLLTETSLIGDNGPALVMLDRIIIGVLVLEILLRFISTGPRFFERGWNVFDTVIISISVYAMIYNIPVLQAIRIMLLFRIVELIPTMKHVVEAIKRAVKGLMNATILLLVIFYTFAVASTHLFGVIAADHFGNVGKSMFTLFQLMAFDNMGDIIRPIMEVHDSAWVFFIVFLVMTSFSILNLFIGIIVQAMQDASDALAAQKKVKKDNASKLAKPVTLDPKA